MDIATYEGNWRGEKTGNGENDRNTDQNIMCTKRKKFE